MFNRDNTYYGILNDGLSAIGYTGASAFDTWVNDVFAQKYNAEKTFKEMGFALDPSLPINATYEMFEVEVHPYTMGAYVDIDSDGPTKHTHGASLKMGNIPTFKHEVTMTRKTMREMAQLREMLNGQSNDTINSTIMGLMYNGSDKLLGGNYNTFAYQRHQIVSNKAKLVIDAVNNPAGIPIVLDFGIDNDKQVITGKHVISTAGAEVADNAKNLLNELKLVRRTAEQRDFAPAGHWEVAKSTWDKILDLEAIRTIYAQCTYPTAAADSASLEFFGKMADDDVIKSFIEKKIGARIEVIDAKGYAEKYNKTTGAMEDVVLDAFKPGWMVYVPDGEIGTAQFGKPFYIDTPGALTALFDGGRTLLRTVFNDENMNYVIKSEVIGLCVPNKARWFYYFQIVENAD